MRLQSFWLCCLAVTLIGCGNDSDTPADGKETAATAKPPKSAVSQPAAAVATSEPDADEAQTAAPDPGPSSEPAAGGDSESEATSKSEPTSKEIVLEEPAAAAPPAAVPTATDPPATSTAPQNGVAVDLSYIDSEFAAGAMIRPRQAMRSAFGKAVIENVFQGTEFQDASKEFAKNFGVDLENIEQMAVLVREQTIANMAGVSLSADSDGIAVSESELQNKLKQIALSFHNYADAHKAFPPATGKLSWRVHLLPFLEQVELYNRFDLEEDWDSDTNKPLIDEMPDIFKVPGVEDAGKTSIHVFVGENAPFEEQLSFANIVDGTANTIMAALAGADTKAEWTKPGGLKIDDENPMKSFGTTKDGVMVAMLDGSVQTLPPDLAAETVRALLTHAGGEIVERFNTTARNPDPKPEQNPTVIAHCHAAIDQEKAVRMIAQGFDEPTKKTGNGKEYWDVGGYVVWFPNPKTMIATQTKLLPRLMSNRSEESKLRKIFKAHGGSDLLLVGDAEAMPKLAAMMAAEAPIPNARSITGVWQSVDVSSESRPLFSSNITMGDEQSAGGMQAMLGASIAMGQQQLTPANAPPGMESMMETLSSLTKGVKVEREGKTISYTIPKPKEYGKGIDAMKAEFKKLGDSVRDARSAARRMVRKNALKQIGLAFHNHHDVYNTFGAADGSTKNRKGGLSWRVHLLPFMEQAPLYEKFNLKEPWDSEHNKKLIAEMPDLFKVEGIADEGKTSIHVILGEGAAFGDGKTPLAIADMIDGTSNTFLAVQAGADKADFWTKPGGLELDEENPLGILGNFGELFLVLMGDGSVHHISKAIDKDVLKAMMTHQGREVLDENDFREIR